MISTEDFAALVSSRICHDLISPIGAIGNGVELMTMTGHGEGPEIALISESAESASARVRFFRIAFGSAKEGQSIGTEEIGAILTARAKDGRFRYSWKEDAPIDRSVVKLTFLAILCVEHTMPRGGEIRVARDRGEWNRGAWIVETDAAKTHLDPELWNAVERGEVPQHIDSGRIQFAALALALEARGSRLAVRRTDAQLTLSF